jgi:excisionase family DNA binding protein
MTDKKRGPGRPRKEERPPTWNELPDVLTVTEVAAFYRVDESTIYELVARNELPFPVHRFGRAIRFGKYELAGLPKDVLEQMLGERNKAASKVS